MKQFPRGCRAMRCTNRAETGPAPEALPFRAAGTAREPRAGGPGLLSPLPGRGRLIPGIPSLPGCRDMPMASSRYRVPLGRRDSAGRNRRCWEKAAAESGLHTLDGTNSAQDQSQAGLSIALSFQLAGWRDCFRQWCSPHTTGGVPWVTLRTQELYGNSLCGWGVDLLTPPPPSPTQPWGLYVSRCSGVGVYTLQ